MKKRVKYIEAEGATVSVEFNEETEGGMFRVQFGSYVAASGAFSATAGGVHLDIAPKGDSRERLLVTKVLGEAINDGLFENETTYQARVAAWREYHERAPETGANDSAVADATRRRWKLAAAIAGLAGTAEIARMIWGG